MELLPSRFAAALPGDPSPDPRPRPVRGAAWSTVAPTPVAAPRLLALSQPMAEALGFDAAETASPEFLALFSGNRVPPGLRPLATNYGGHQFGHWAGQLGDGRAILLGERRDREGRYWELQLKGAGPTPYSRQADGRAVLRSSLREFVASEAMHALGVPTTRALCLIGSGEAVVRDLLYDGHPRPEPGAIVCRAAPSFLRFGHCELPASRGETALLAALVDHVIATHFPQFDGPHARGDWFSEVARRTGVLMAHWMRVGFVHGVMNTDNLSLLGLTLDYGPFGFLDDVNPAWTPNTTDLPGRRYCYAAQPAVAHWNLSALASALSALFPDDAPLKAGLEAYVEAFHAAQARMWADKLGLADVARGGRGPGIRPVRRAAGRRGGLHPVLPPARRTGGRARRRVAREAGSHGCRGRPGPAALSPACSTTRPGRERGAPRAGATGSPRYAARLASDPQARAADGAHRWRPRTPGSCRATGCCSRPSRPPSRATCPSCGR
ncbi:MAG: hypothetical protein KatS3mg127_0134 [Silanimonas sp.]|nr:MAG: hypothetical protein KatS3mg127_0134 [Silanimonas sp.]